MVPVAWDINKKVWFDIYKDAHEMPVQSLKWDKHINNWNNRCANCHSSGLVKNYDFKDVSTNVYFAICNVFLDALMYGISFIVMDFFYEYKIITWENTGVLYWFIAFIGQDFLYYIHHYVDHHSRFFWAVHVTHHNSQFYNITTGFRSPVLQPFYRFVFLIPLILIGIEPLHIMFAYAMNQNYGTLCHTNFIKKNSV